MLRKILSIAILTLASASLMAGCSPEEGSNTMGAGPEAGSSGMPGGGGGAPAPAPQPGVQ